jgi:hypothetical protein
MMGAATEAPPEPITGQTEAVFDDGPVGRLLKQAYDKDVQVEELEEAGDTEGADISRVEADQCRKEAADLKAKLAEEGEETGSAEPVDASAEEQARADAAVADADALPEDIVVRGLDIKPASLGGKAPTSGTLKLVGGKVKLVNGTFLKKGTVVTFSGTAIVNDVGVKDIEDTATRQVTDAIQNHQARIRSLVVDIPEAQ